MTTVAACGVAFMGGVGEAIHTLPGEISFVLGFGMGTFVAVKIKSRWIETRELPKKGQADGNA